MGGQSLEFTGALPMRKTLYLNIAVALWTGCERDHHILCLGDRDFVQPLHAHGLEDWPDWV